MKYFTENYKTMNFNDYTRKELAALKGLTYGALLHYLMREGAPKPYKRGGAWYYDKSECDNWKPIKNKRGRKPLSRTASNDSVGESSAEVGGVD